MKYFYKTLSLVILLFSTSIMTLDAQRTCSSDEHMQELMSDPEFVIDYQQRQLKFEAVQESHKTKSQITSKSALCPNPVVLPVAVHFQGIGSPNQACLVALAQGQIDIINNDFQGTNTEIASLWNAGISNDFPPTLDNGETCVEFCLATSSHPSGYGLLEGQPAVTINATSGDFNSDWSGYINVWVRNIGALGYSPLGGNGNGDGVTIDVSAFGAGSGCSGVVPGFPFDEGRTLTHELGHFFNLGHIWGGGCGADDGVADTPDSSGPYGGCPNNPSASCGSNDLHMSYMDYSDDRCMYMFSQGQSTRMENWITANLGNVAANSSVCSPPAPHCSNGVQDFDETGVDCGGADCSPCPPPCGVPDVTLSITTDRWGAETTWQITDGGGVVASGGPYVNQGVNGEYPQPDVVLSLSDGDYSLTFFDSFGDGMCCAYGNGSYSLTDSEGTVLASGGTFVSSETTSFCLSSNTGCEAFATAPVDLTKSFDPVNGVQDRVQVKWYKDTPQVKYSDEDAAMCDIKFWAKRNLDPVTGNPIGPTINNPDTVNLVDVKKTYGDNSPREIFKWPVKFRADGANNNKRADPNIRYEWQVRCECGHDGSGPESPWSAVKIFNTPDFDPATGIYTPPPGVFEESSTKLNSFSEILLMPNPASESLRIWNADGLPDTFDWYIIDMTGRILISGNVRGNKSDYLELELNQMAQGTYQIMLVNEKFSSSSSFLIRR